MYYQYAGTSQYLSVGRSSTDLDFFFFSFTAAHLQIRSNPNKVFLNKKTWYVKHYPLYPAQGLHHTTHVYGLVTSSRFFPSPLSLQSRLLLFFFSHRFSRETLITLSTQTTKLTWRTTNRAGSTSLERMLHQLPSPSAQFLMKPIKTATEELPPSNLKNSS